MSRSYPQALNLLALAALLVGAAQGCLGQQDEVGEPRTIQETGFLTCESGHAGCEGGLWCAAAAGEEAGCVEPPAQCVDSLDCDCLEEWMCPGAACFAEDAQRLLCKPIDEPLPGEGEGEVDPVGGDPSGEGEGEVDPVGGEGEGEVDPVGGEGEGEVDPVGGEGEGEVGGEGEGEVEGCAVYDPDSGCADNDGWFWWFDGEGCQLMDGCTCAGCPGTFATQAECVGECGVEVGGGPCGGFVGAQCPAGEYCDFPDDTCGGDDGMGVCRPTPDDCPPPAPGSGGVCACDQQRYPSACDAAQDGASDLNVFGSCEAPFGLFPCGAHFCSLNDQYCERQLGDAFPPEFQCKQLPNQCIRGALPACDCMDGVPCSDACEDLEDGSVRLTCQPACPDADADGRCDDEDLICNVDGLDVVCLSVPPGCEPGEVPESEGSCWTERCLTWDACAEAVAGHGR